MFNVLADIFIKSKDDTIRNLYRRILKGLKMEDILKAASPFTHIKQFSKVQLTALCSALRREIITTVSKNGGHLASNLGSVELTVALLRTFTPPNDKIVWDVGHQSYSYKILTHRREAFATLRRKGGLSGFPKTAESEYDSFISGHASTSLAVAAGLKASSELKCEDREVVAVIGDGALTGGLAFEGLNNIGKQDSRVIIILNDNEMSISKNTGALSQYLSKIRTTPTYFKLKRSTADMLQSVPFVGGMLKEGVKSVKETAKRLVYGTFFEQFGIAYLGPVDGHDILSMCDVFEEAKQYDCPVIVHVNTVKGKGYRHARLSPSDYHGVSPFSPQEGIKRTTEKSQDFSAVFGEELTRLATRDSDICAITAAMESGTGLTTFAQRHPERFFDVGIAEGYGVTFAAALNAGGVKPVFAVYSTFLQRAYDNLLHDASLEKRHVVLAIDRAGAVGADGETHQGIFDVGFLSTIPNITIYASSTYEELRCQLSTALYRHNGVVAVRYPKGKEPTLPQRYLPKGDDFTFCDGDSRVCIVTYGCLYGTVVGAVTSMSNPPSVMKLGKIHPISPDVLKMLSRFEKLLFVEDTHTDSTVAKNAIYSLSTMGTVPKTSVIAFCDVPDHMTVNEAHEHYGITRENIVKEVENLLGI